MLDEHVLGGCRAALHAVDNDDVGAGGHSQLHVMVDPGGADFDVDRDGPVGRLAQLLDLDAQIVGADPIGVAAGRALVDTRRERAHAGHPLVDLLAQQEAATAGLGPLADHDLDGVGLA